MKIIPFSPFGTGQFVCSNTRAEKARPNVYALPVFYTIVPGFDPELLATNSISKHVLKNLNDDACYCLYTQKLIQFKSSLSEASNDLIGYWTLKGKAHENRTLH